MLLARIMLQVGVGEKRTDRVEDRRRGEHALAGRGKGETGLQREHHEAERRTAPC